MSCHKYRHSNFKVHYRYVDKAREQCAGMIVATLLSFEGMLFVRVTYSVSRPTHSAARSDPKKNFEVNTHAASALVTATTHNVRLYFEVPSHAIAGEWRNATGYTGN